MCILLSVAQILDYCGFMVSIKSGTVSLLSLFIFKTVLSVLGLLLLCINFSIGLLISTKQLVKFLTRIECKQCCASCVPMGSFAQACKIAGHLTHGPWSPMTHLLVPGVSVDSPSHQGVLPWNSLSWGLTHLLEAARSKLLIPRAWPENHWASKPLTP